MLPQSMDAARRRSHLLLAGVGDRLGQIANHRGVLGAHCEAAETREQKNDKIIGQAAMDLNKIHARSSE